MKADIESNKKLKPIATKLFLRGRKLNLSLVIISQSSCYYLTISRWPKLRLIATRYFIIKIPNKRELQQIASNHSSDIDFKDCMKLYNDYTKEPYSFLVMMMMMMMMMMMNWWWLIVFVVWLTGERCLALLPARTIVRDPHYFESTTHRKQILNLRRTWVQV